MLYTHFIHDFKFLITQTQRNRKQYHTIIKTASKTNCAASIWFIIVSKTSIQSTVYKHKVLNLTKSAN